MQGPPEDAPDHGQIRQVHRAHETIPRFVEIERECPPAWPEHPEQLADCVFEIWHVPQAVPCRHEIERVVWERQRAHIADDEFHGASACPFASQFDHSGGDVESDYVSASIGELPRDVPCTGRQVERLCSAKRHGKVNESTLPASIETERKSNGYEIVTIGNGRKEPTHVPALGFGRGESLTERTAAISPEHGQ
jgi:hypothetical protein